MHLSSFLHLSARTLTLFLSVLALPISTWADPIGSEKRPPRPPKDALLNLDFGGAEPWLGIAATGDTPSDYWNPYWAPYQLLGHLPDLLWSDGQLSGVSATVENAPGAWTNDHPDGMMNTFIHSFGYQPITVTLANLPNGTYDVYV